MDWVVVMNIFGCVWKLEHFKDKRNNCNTLYSFESLLECFVIKIVSLQPHSQWVQPHLPNVNNDSKIICQNMLLFFANNEASKLYIGVKHLRDRHAIDLGYFLGSITIIKQFKRCVNYGIIMSSNTK